MFANSSRRAPFLSTNMQILCFKKKKEEEEREKTNHMCFLLLPTNVNIAQVDRTFLYKFKNRVTMDVFWDVYKYFVNCLSDQYVISIQTYCFFFVLFFISLYLFVCILSMPFVMILAAL